jgi:methionyl-tRNA formyltransferase
MRIIFMGTPEFAVPSLEILVQNHLNVVAVVTSPDHYGGRGGKVLLESAVKKSAAKLGIPVLQPTNLKSESFLAELKSFHADVQIVVAFRMLPEVVWNMPRLGTFNLHGSLLPKYRGAAPINHAIIQGEKVTGVTSFKLQHTIDTGDIMLQEEIPIELNETAGELHDKMMFVGANVILRTVQQLQQGNVTFYPQKEGAATLAPKIFHHTCKIDFHQPVLTVHNFVRGLSPYPGAWCVIDGKEIKLLKADIILEPDSHSEGFIKSEDKKSLLIKCQDGYLKVLELKPEGKKTMKTSDFLNGYQIQHDEAV